MQRALVIVWFAGVIGLALRLLRVARAIEVAVSSAAVVRVMVLRPMADAASAASSAAGG